MGDNESGQKALAAIDDILSQRPKKDDHALAQATMCLAEFREHLIHRRSSPDATPPDHERLSRLNAILSVVLGMHFPLGNAPWDELQKARGWLSDLVQEARAATEEQSA